MESRTARRESTRRRGTLGTLGARATLGVLGALWLCGRAPTLHAQAAPPPAVPGVVTPLVLQLRPRPGDLLRLRLDQTIEMGVSDRGIEDSTATDVTSLVMLARLSVESTDLAGATVMAVADSVRIENSGSYQSDVLRQARMLQGQRFRFRVAPDGSTTLSGADAWAGPAVGTLLSQLPATLPAEPIAPGATWNRSVDIPLAAAPDGKASATLTATFRFDSLSRTGEYAYLSMKGRLVRSGAMQGGANGGGGGGRRLRADVGERHGDAPAGPAAWMDRRGALGDRVAVAGDGAREGFAAVARSHEDHAVDARHVNRGRGRFRNRWRVAGR